VGQAHTESRSFARLALDFDLSTVMVDQEETGHEVDAEFFGIVVADQELARIVLLPAVSTATPVSPTSSRAT